MTKRFSSLIGWRRLIVPFSNFLKKSYEKSVGAAVGGVQKKNYAWSSLYYLDESTIHTEMMSINPSPTGDTIVYHRISCQEE